MENTEIILNYKNIIENFRTVENFIRGKNQYTVDGAAPQNYPVIKGNAYGVGQNEVAEELLNVGQENFFTFNVDEAI